MNFLKKFIGSASTDEVISLPSGKLFLTRSPNSPKGELECLYNDAFASIRQTTTPFFYRLFVTRVYQEGELNANEDGGFEDSEDEDEFDERHNVVRSANDPNSVSGHSKDEYGFTISDELKFHYYEKGDGTRAISWKDLNGDLGDRFEFIVDEDCSQADVDNFMLALFKCQYEQRYHKSSLGFTNISQLKEFAYDPKAELLTFEDLNKDINWDEDEEEEDEDPDYTEPARRARRAPVPVAVESESESESDSEFHDATTGIVKSKPTSSSPSAQALVTAFQYNEADLHVYDSESESFKLLAEKPAISIVDAGDWKYYLKIVDHFDVLISKDINPVFSYDYNAFIFNYFNSPTTIASYLLKFPDFETLSNFQNIFMTQLWQSLNKQKFGQTVTNKSEMDYVLDAFSNVNVDDDDLNDEDRMLVDALSDDEPEQPEEEISTSKIRQTTKESKLFVDSDDDDDDFDQEAAKFKNNASKNSNLSVGYSKDRSYVVRGDKLGVFKNSDEDLTFQTTISDLTTLKGKRFTPLNTMLHQQDQFMVMQNSDLSDENKLFKMDLERGKIIEEWEVGRDQAIKSFAPNTKFSQLTAEQTLTGVSLNGMFKIDPRLQTKDKLVNDNTLKLYKTKNNDFLLVATTQAGFIAVGSKRGDVRLYDRLGINAKTALPSLGEPIKGLDVSADGRWLLATCETYLLLIDNKIGEGQRNEGSLGFLKSFDKDKKPKPRRLTIKPEHTAYMYNESGGKPLSFTVAHFNTGVSTQESTIVTSSGPYVITWSLKKILKPKKASKSAKSKVSADSYEDSYLIKRYKEDVIADNFKFGSNADVILALLNDVTMDNKKIFNRATKSYFTNTSKNSVVQEL